MGCNEDQLSEQVKDVLTELGNIGAGNATTSLSVLLSSKLTMTAPTVKLYNFDELAQVIKRTAEILDIKITDEGASAIARCSRGTPRIANRLVKRVSDFAIVKYDGEITEEVATDSLKALKIDEFGLDSTDRALLNMIIEKYDGGPVGINTLAAALGEDIRTLEDVCEPYLLQIGLLQRTPQGRKVSPEGYRHLGIKMPSEQRRLFED